MMGKADSLRTRLSIDPDELAGPPPVRPVGPIAQRRPATPAESAESETSDAAQVEPAPAEAEAPPKAAPARQRTERRSPVKASKPAEPDGEAYFRSFYVSNDVYAAFRAAIFWTSRNPRAVGHVPENMSAAVEQALVDITTDLQKRFNEGEPFPEPPPTRRRRKRST
jgi:hypothetical protein